MKLTLKFPDGDISEPSKHGTGTDKKMKQPESMADFVIQGT
jgi:hypothetical protein